MEEKTKNYEIVKSLLWLALIPIVVIIMFGRPLIMQENAYRKVRGTIVNSSAGERNYYIHLRTRRTSSARFTVPRHITRRHNEVLQEKAVVGGRAIIWYEPVRRGDFGRGRRGAGGSGRRRHIIEGNFIKKMIVDNEVIIPFRRDVVMIIFVSVFGLLLVVCIVYIVKNLRQQ